MEYSIPSKNITLSLVVKQCCYSLLFLFILVIILTILTTFFLYIKYYIIATEKFNSFELINDYKNVYYIKYPEKFSDIMNNTEHLLIYSFVCANEFVEKTIPIPFSI